MNQDRRTEFFATLALRHTPGLGTRRLGPILAAYPSAKSALDAAAAWPGKRLAPPDCAKNVRAQSWREEAEKEYRAALARGAEFLLYHDPEYPDRLRRMHAPPPLLYFRGDTGLLSSPAVAVVGSRKATAEGSQAALDLCARLSRYGVTVISGMALGIDRQAHLGGLSGLGGSIGLLGAGLDVDYPKRNRDLRASMEHRGLLLTEFSPGAPARPKHFPQRNRIISGLSLAVAVMEAQEKSGSLITAQEGLEQGLEIFARPGSPGCERLLDDGAHPLRSAEDMLLVLRDVLRARIARGPLQNPMFGPCLPAPQAPPVGYSQAPGRHPAGFPVNRGRSRARIRPEIRPNAGTWSPPRNQPQTPSRNQKHP